VYSTVDSGLTYTCSLATLVLDGIVELQDVKVSRPQSLTTRRTIATTPRSEPLSLDATQLKSLLDPLGVGNEVRVRLKLSRIMPGNETDNRDVLIC